jgi:hypothetical protein
LLRLSGAIQYGCWTEVTVLIKILFIKKDSAIMYRKNLVLVDAASAQLD